MMENIILLDNSQIQQGLYYLAHKAFAGKFNSEEGVPDFLKNTQQEVQGFQSYVRSNPDLIAQQISKVTDDLERTCITYGVLKQAGGYVYNNEKIASLMLQGYFSLIELSRGSKDSNIFIKECVELMLPTTLPYLDTKNKDGINLSDLENIAPAKRMLEIFYDEYSFPDSTDLSDSLFHLLHLFYFIGILLHQDCRDIKSSDIGDLVLFIKGKMLDLSAESLDLGILLRAESLGSIYCCVRVCNKIGLAPNAELYLENKSLLFSLILKLILPVMSLLNEHNRTGIMAIFDLIERAAFDEHPICEKMRLDICIALFTLGSINLERISLHISNFALDNLIEMVDRIHSSVPLGSNGLAHVIYMGLIMQKSILAQPSCSQEIKDEFFTRTKTKIRNALVSAMALVAELFYFKPLECYAGILQYSHNKQNYLHDSGKLDASCFFIILGLFKDYKNMFPSVTELLLEFQVVHIVAMDKTKSWASNPACILLQKVTKCFENCGIPRKDLDFITVKISGNELCKRIATKTFKSLNREEMIFWEKLFEVFHTMTASVKDWDENQKNSIDALCGFVIDNLNFSHENTNVMVDVKLAVILSNLISMEARIAFYSIADKILYIMNSDASKGPAELMYQMLLTKRWLLDYVPNGDKAVNSRALAQLKIFPQQKSMVLHQLLYICQLAEIIYYITQRLSCFDDKSALYSKINELSAFILKERKTLYTKISNLKGLESDFKSQMLLQNSQGFIDNEISLLLSAKMHSPLIDKVKPIIRKNIDIIAISNIEFTQDKVIVCSENNRFNLPFENMLPLNILRAKVYSYKGQNKYILATDYDPCKLLPLTVENTAANEPSSLTDDQLLNLFATKSQKTNIKKKPKKKPKRHDKDVLAVQSENPIKSKENPNNNPHNKLGVEVKKPSKKQNKSLPLVDVPVVKELCENEPKCSTPSWEDRLSKELESINLGNLTEAASSILSLVENKLGFRADFKVSTDNLICFSLGSSQLLLDSNKSSGDLWEEFAAMPAKLLAESAAGSFARIIYSAEGTAMRVGLAEPLTEHFNISPRGIKKGDISKAIERLQSAFLESLQEKLKVQVYLDRNALSLIMYFTAKDPHIESCDLRLVSSTDLWSRLLAMHSNLIQHRIGGNMALIKLDLDADSNIVAIDRSEYLPDSNLSLQKVLVKENLADALDAFFAPLNSKTFNVFKSLNYKHVEFTLRVIQEADVAVIIYGQPVFESLYGDLMQASGMTRYPIERLVIKLNYDQNPDIRMITNIGAIIKGVTEDAIYCAYYNCSITVCINPDYMQRSVFSGDRFAFLLSKAELSYINMPSNYSKLDQIIATGPVDSEKVLSNPYILKTTLAWNKIMGKLGGGLKAALQRLGFVSFITSSDLENTVWSKGANSCEFLPEAPVYLQSKFRLSDLEAKEVLEEVKEILKY